MWKLRSKFVSIIWCWGERSMYHEGHDNMSHTAWWQSTFISKIINIYQKIKKLHSWYENVPKNQLIDIKIKGTWRSWWFILHSVLVAHLYAKYHKSISKNKKLHSWYENAPKYQLFELEIKDHMQVVIMYHTLSAGSTHSYQIS